jgi:hypothetical protein
MGKDSKEAKSRLEDIKYYTSLFLGTLSIVCVFGFLFLVPFVLDPAISTLMHDFVERAVHCKVGQSQQGFSAPSNCRSVSFILSPGLSKRPIRLFSFCEENHSDT